MPIGCFAGSGLLGRLLTETVGPSSANLISTYSDGPRLIGHERRADGRRPSPCSVSDRLVVLRVTDTVPREPSGWDDRRCAS